MTICSYCITDGLWIIVLWHVTLFPGRVVSNILNTLRSVEMSGATHTMTQHQILEDLCISALVIREPQILY